MPEASLIEWLARLSRLLRHASVPHALAGGLAVAVWARPRATVDIDLVVLADDDAIASIRKVCRRAGLLQTNRSISVFRRIRLLRMSIAPTPSRETIAVDFLLVPRPLEQQILSRARSRRVGGVAIPVASAEDTVLLKLLRMSDQDRVDVRAIAAEQRLDRRYLRRWAKQLRLLSRLRSVGLR